MLIRLIYLLTSPVVKEIPQFTVSSLESEVEAVWVPEGWEGPVVAIPLEANVFISE
jgi:hypothetical protein